MRGTGLSVFMIRFDLNDFWPGICSLQNGSLVPFLSAASSPTFRVNRAAASALGRPKAGCRGHETLP